MRHLRKGVVQERNLDMTHFFSWLTEALDSIVEEKIRLFIRSGKETRSRYPNLSSTEVANKIASSAKWHSFGQGAVYSLLTQIPLLIPGPGILIAGGTILASGVSDFIKLFDIQSELVVKIAAVYNYDLDPSFEFHKSMMLDCVFDGKIIEKIAEIADPIGKRVAIQILQRAFQEGIAKKLYFDILEKFGYVVAQRVAKRRLLIGVPVAGAAISGALNSYGTSRVSKNAIELFSTLAN